MPDVKLPPYEVLQWSLGTFAQRTPWANVYHDVAQLYDKTRGEKAVIFILDTAGTFKDHPDLNASNDARLNSNSTNDPDVDGNGHGTHCAGIAAAIDNESGVVGIAPGATLAARKVLSDGGSGSYSAISKEIRAVADLKLPPEHKDKKKIISMSLGGGAGNSTLRSAIQYAIQKGCFVIAASGNSYRDGSENTMNYPAKYEEVIAVGSIKKNEKPSDFSSHGEELDITAFGDGNYSTYKNGSYATLRGTSMATPVIAGFVALVVSAYPTIDTQAKMMRFLKNNAKDIFTDGFDTRTGYGTVTGDKFKIEEPKEPTPEPEPEPPAPEPEPEPTPDTPIGLGWHSMWIDDEFTVLCWNSGDKTRHLLRLKIEAEANCRTEAELKNAINQSKLFFRNRGFQFQSGSNVFDWAEGISHFFRLITKYWYKAPSRITKIWLDKDGLAISFLPKVTGDSEEVLEKLENGFKTDDILTFNL